MSDTSPPLAFLCRRFTPNVEAALQARFLLSKNDDDQILSPDEIVARAADAEVLFVSATESLRGETIRRLPKLRAIATLSVGFDHIDLETCRSAGIRVLNTPDVLSDACAEIGMMLLLNACRRGYEADRMVRTGAWPGWSPTQLLGMGLVGRKLGIFGMGRIGRAIAARAKSFGLGIQYHNRRRLAADMEDGAFFCASLDELLETSDIFLIAAPGSPDLKGMVNAEKIARLRKGSVVVNISRGDLVDDAALVDALKKGHVRAAGLDVFANEPSIHPGYCGLDNVFLSPHIGSATFETRDAMGYLLVGGLEAIARGESPSNLLV